MSAIAVVFLGLGVVATWVEECVVAVASVGVAVTGVDIVGVGGEVQTDIGE